jgi:hypothetical protein
VPDAHDFAIIGANIRLNGGWSHPYDSLITPSVVPVSFCWVMESLIKSKINRKTIKTIFTKTKELSKAQKKHFFRKCPFIGPLKTSSPSKSCNLYMLFRNTSEILKGPI